MGDWSGVGKLNREVMTFVAFDRKTAGGRRGNEFAE